MRTKIVYVVISSLNDVYWEQAWASAWSVKYYNPHAIIAIVSDNDSFGYAENSYRKRSLDLFDEKIPVEFDSGTENKQRSRWIKTNLRNIVHGDFLFIDTDTIITGDLSEIDQLCSSVGMVYDAHINHCVISSVFPLYKKAYNEEAPSSIKYFNSGVIFAKDDENARILFDEWHNNWIMAGDKLFYTDQIPLARSILKLNFPIYELPGVYNCQICNSVKYIHKAKILHFFNHPWFIPTVIHPFMLKDFYERIKKSSEITKDIEEDILNCKSLFTDISVPVALNEAKFMHSTMIRLLLLLYKKHCSFYQKIDNFLYFIIKKSGRIFKK